MYGLIRRGCALGAVALALVLAGCGSTPINKAPVEDRSAAAKSVAAAGVPVVKPAPGFENAGKPGYYAVKPGDTLIRIGLENGQSPKDIAKWNALENPNKIEVGQILRVVPPSSSDSAAVAVAKPVANSSVTSTPIAPAASSAASAAPATAASKPASSPAVVAAPVAAAGAGAAAVGDEDLGWIWPAKGPVLVEFDEVKNKGLDIGGTVGDAVLASAEGKVVYAGEGLRGYGKLIILKHNNTFLTAYAHNQTLLVKEDQSVKKGQKIAEMGNSDADRVKLHFEVRRQGKPVDPSKYLPAR
jgi:lipoprotein NlpD